MKRDFSILGVGFNDLNMEEALELIFTGLKNDTKNHYVVTPNPELLVLADGSPEFKSALNDAKLALADGIGVVFAAKLLGYPIKGRVQGVDLVENLAREASKKLATTSYLGARPGVAEETAECLQKRYPGLKVSFAKDELEDLSEMVKTDILFVAFGSPKQELWIKENIDRIPARVVIGVGGSFDFISGRVRRAPVFLRRLGLEWLFRLILQPWRLKRQLSLLTFICLVLREKFLGSKKTP